jgi:peptide/nickel transport system permease protein
VSARRSRAAGLVLLAVLALAAALAPAIATHDPAAQFADFVHAPPMRPRMIDADGRWRTPFVYPVRLVDRLERRYEEDRARPMPLVWFADGRLVSVAAGPSPWLPLGGDALGRDVFARIVYGARLSLGVAAVAALAALLAGALAGALAGYTGGAADEALMRAADFLLVLPAIYVVLALRAAMPLVLTDAQVFWTMVGAFAATGWPYPARAVRAVVAVERQREYAEAARALGASRTRILLRHLLPAARGVLWVQAALLLPAFILAEATLSFVGFGFPEPLPSWGLMLQDAGRVAVLSEAPWLLAPAGAIVVAVLAVHLVSQTTSPLTKR